MASYQINNFNRISFYSEITDEVPELTKSILFSSIPKNEKLGMMNADFNISEKIPLINLINPTGLTDEQVEVLSNIGMMQVDDDEDTEINDNYESYVILPNSKLIVLKVDKDYKKLRLFNSDTLKGIDIILVNSQNGLPNNTPLNKLVIIGQLNDISEFTPSVSLHENSDDPHSNLGSKILLSQDYYNKIYESEITNEDKIYCTKAELELGIGTEDSNILNEKFELGVNDDYELIISI